MDGASARRLGSLPAGGRVTPGRLGIRARAAGRSALCRGLWEVISGDAFRRARQSDLRTETLMQRPARGLGSPLNVTRAARETDAAPPTVQQRIDNLKESFVVWPCHREEGLRPRLESPEQGLLQRSRPPAAGTADGRPSGAVRAAVGHGPARKPGAGEPRVVRAVRPGPAPPYQGRQGDRLRGARLRRRDDRIQALRRPALARRGGSDPAGLAVVGDRGHPRGDRPGGPSHPGGSLRHDRLAPRHPREPRTRERDERRQVGYCATSTGRGRLAGQRMRRRETGVSKNPPGREENRTRGG